jgi:UDP-glucose 4-epimerase/UDP-glucuronate decarboxylase
VGASGRRRILITGGAGFIGYHLAGRLLEDPANEVVLADDFSRGRRDGLLDDLVARPAVRLHPGDLTSPATFGRLGEGYDEVFHLAAVLGVRNVVERPHEVLRVNALSTLYLLEWFVRGGGQKLLFASTSEAYAWTQQFHPLPVPTPEDVPLALTDLADPRSSYAGSKAHGELLVQQYCRAFRKPFVVVRFHNVYGPRMGYEHVIPELYARAAGGQDPLVVYSADHRRAFCYVSDAVAATVAAMREPAASGQTLNVGNDREEVTIAELARQLLEVAGIRAGLRPEQARSDPVRRRCPDLARARAFLGYEPQVPLRTGLERTLSWYAGESGREGASRGGRFPLL